MGVFATVCVYVNVPQLSIITQPPLLELLYEVTSLITLIRPFYPKNSLIM